MSNSEPDKGTTFRIFLPRHIPAADEVQAPQLPETTAPAIAGAISAADEVMRTATDLTGHGTILLVEDEEGLRALNARGLISRGYTVIEAGNGVEAIDALERHGGQVDLVVSDVVMPEMDGPTLLKELRKRNPDDQDHLRVGLCRRRIREEPAGRAAELPGQAVHAQATGRP